MVSCGIFVTVRVDAKTAAGCSSWRLYLQVLLLLNKRL
jgi:hypothetical protein